MARTAETDYTGAKWDLRMVQGDDFADSFTIKEGSPPALVDVSARTYAMRVQPDGGGTVINATISMAAAAVGKITFSLTDTQTAAMLGNYHWDLDQTTAGIKRTILRGKFQVVAQVPET